MKRYWLLSIVLVLGWWIYGEQSSKELQGRIDNAKTPQALVAVILDNPQATASIAQGTLDVQFDRKAIRTAAKAISGFNLDVARLVPNVFERFPEITTIRVVARGPFKDIRGNESTNHMFRITFTRANAATIRWKNIVYGNIPRIADNYWVNPSLLKD